MPADHRAVQSCDVPTDLDSGGVGGGEKHRRPAVGAGLARGAGHDDEEPGAVGPGDEVLAAVDRPAAVGLDRAGRQRRRVRPGPRSGFGHRERGADVAAGEGFEVALFLLGVGDVREHVHVALVGRRDIQCGRAEQRVAAGFEHRRAVDHVQAGSAVLDGCVWGEHAGVAGGLLEVDAQFVAAGRGDIAAVRVLDRQHRALDERRATRDEILDLGRVGKVECHKGLLETVSGACDRPSDRSVRP